MAVMLEQRERTVPAQTPPLELPIGTPTLFAIGFYNSTAEAPPSSPQASPEGTFASAVLAHVPMYWDPWWEPP